MQNSNLKNGAKRPVSFNKRRRKKNNNYLYIGIALSVVALALLAGIIIAATGSKGKDDVSSEDNAVNGVVSDEISKPAFEEISETESDASSDSKPDISETTDDVSIDSSLTPTELYEKETGIKYAIDMTDYEKFVCPEDEEKYVFIVDPDHPLGEDYVPEGLVHCDSIRNGRPKYFSQMVDVANEALTAFLKEAAYYGFDDISVTNAYRSYDIQKGLFENYCKQEWESGKFKTYEDAVNEVLTYSTRPGTSEHQSGLCCDMHNVSVSAPTKFNNTKAAKWLEENACRFGFILRYPEGKQDVTGIMYESWHFRYVGRTAATEIHDRGITLDEYLK